MKKCFMSLFAVLFLFTATMSNGVEASAFKEDKNQIIHFETIKEFEDAIENNLIPIDELNQQGLGIPIFIGGIIIGYLASASIDAILLDQYGFTGSQIILIGYNAFLCWNKPYVTNKEFHIYNDGSTFCSYSLGPLPPK